ncbi:MAG: toprim domain-containing protein, partial [Hyphomicrobiaceae bacterium]|nr:toprim domain-containing protein [Hyphomicrobiaceae bacterium]
VPSGMCVVGCDISVPYDRFRDRLMFPIEELNGKLIAFGGRALSAAQKAKYLNSPETPLFHKGRLLYNIARARQSAYDRQSVIAVEGYMDAIACAKAGFDNVVAPLGTAMTVQQIQLMWRLAREPVLCFDGDEAGRKAAWRAVDTVLPELAPGFSLRFAFLPEGQDPDDLINKEGAAAFGQVVNVASSLVDVLWRRELQQAPTDTPERRAAFEARIYDKIGQIADGAVKAHYEKEVRQRLWNLWREQGRASPGQQGAKSRTRRPYSPTKSGGWGGKKGGFWRDEPQPASDRLRQSTLVRGPKKGLSPGEALVLEAVLNHPWLLDDYSEEFAELTFMHNDLVVFRDAILQLQIEFSGQNTLDRKQLDVHLKESGFGDTLERVGAAHIDVDRWVRSPEQSHKKIEESWQQALNLYQRQMYLQNQLDIAERAFKEDDSEENNNKIRDLNARYQDNENMFARSDAVANKEGLSEYLSVVMAERGLK